MLFIECALKAQHMLQIPIILLCTYGAKQVAAANAG